MNCTFHTIYNTDSTSRILTIVDDHTAILMLKLHVVQPEFTLTSSSQRALSVIWSQMLGWECITISTVINMHSNVSLVTISDFVMLYITFTGAIYTEVWRTSTTEWTNPFFFRLTSKRENKRMKRMWMATMIWVPNHVFCYNAETRIPCFGGLSHNSSIMITSGQQSNSGWSFMAVQIYPVSCTHLLNYLSQ